MFAYGFFMSSLCVSLWFAYGFFMSSLWFAYGFFMSSLCLLYGLLMSPLYLLYTSYVSNDCFYLSIHTVLLFQKKSYLCTQKMWTDL